MTNYLLPETDRIAADVNPLLDTVAEAPIEVALAMETGAVTVIGLLGESLSDLRDQARESARAAGQSQAEADEPFGKIMDALFGILQPRLDAFKGAIRVAQGVVPQTEEEAAEALLNGLLSAMLGDEVAAQIIAEAAAEESEVEVEDDDYDDYLNDECPCCEADDYDYGYDEDDEPESVEVQVVSDGTLSAEEEAEVEAFMRFLFGNVA